MTEFDRIALEHARRAFVQVTGKRPRVAGERATAYFRDSVTGRFGVWLLSCRCSEDWAWVEVRLQTLDEDATLPVIAEIRLSGQPTDEEWADAIRRALNLAAKRVDRAARTLPVPRA